MIGISVNNVVMYVVEMKYKHRQKEKLGLSRPYTQQQMERQSLSASLKTWCREGQLRFIAIWVEQGLYNPKLNMVTEN